MDVVKPRIHYTEQKIFYFIGIPLGVFVFLASLFLWQNLRTREAIYFQHEVAASTKIITKALSNKLSDDLAILTRAQIRWNALNGTPEKIWITDAEAIYNDAKIFDALMLLEPDGMTRLMVPKNFELKVDEVAQFPQLLQILLNQSASNNKLIISPIINYNLYQTGFLVVMPLYSSANINGYLLALINLNKMFNNVFDEGVAREFNVSIYQNGANVFSQAHSNTYLHLQQVEHLRISNDDWEIHVWPTEEVVIKHASYLPEMILFTGLIISLLSFVTFYFASLAQQNLLEMIRAKRQAELTSDRLSAILTTVNIGFISVNELGEILFWNPYAEKIFGWQAAEMIEKDIQKIIFSSKSLKEYQTLIQAYLRTGKNKQLNKVREFIAIKKNGTLFPIEMLFIPIEEALESTFHIFVKDITDRKKAEADQARLASLINFSDDAIIIISTDLIIQSWNHGAEVLTGYTALEAIDQSIKLIYPIEKYAELDHHVECLKQGQHVRIDDTVRKHKDGHQVPVSIVLFPLLNLNHEVIGFGLIIRNIFERKKIDRMKNEFISIVSHELKTPLTSIRGSLGLLESEKLGPRSEKGRQLIAIANSNSERLIRFINDILDIEKIESGKIDFNFKDVDLNVLIQEVISANQSHAAKNNVHIVYEPHYETANVLGDYDRLTQVVTNLLSNAIRFSPPNQEVKIILTKIEDKIRVSIIDNGPGIPDNFKNKIFNKFSQADSSDTRKKNGTGLGLNICKAIIEKHYGHISFISEPNQGTIFYFELPCE